MDSIARDICRRRTTCRLCDGSGLELVAHLEPVPLGVKYLTEDQLAEPTLMFPLELFICVDCGHVQLIDVIDPQVLWKDYTYFSSQAPSLIEHFKQVAQSIELRFGPRPGGLVVDIGSNDGSLLRPFKDRGFTVLGIDPAHSIAMEATRSGIETWPEMFTEDTARRIRERYGLATVVTAFNAFAHTDDLAGMTEGIRNVLAPDGVFVFEAQYLADIIDKVLLGTIFHEHLCHHSVKPMAAFLRRHGMELIDVERVPVQHGSIIGAVKHITSQCRPGESVRRLLDLEAARRLDQPATLKAFGALLDGLKVQGQALARDAKRLGKVVAAYGAARSGPTFINQLGLGDVIEWVFDDHPSKVNKYTPGHHIRVLPTAEFLVRKPDYTVILAWVHAQKIIAANQAYLDGGGHFVLCTPTVQVIGRSVGTGSQGLT